MICFRSASDMLVSFSADVDGVKAATLRSGNKEAVAAVAAPVERKDRRELRRRLAFGSVASASSVLSFDPLLSTRPRRRLMKKPLTTTRLRVETTDDGDGANASEHCRALVDIAAIRKRVDRFILKL